MGHPYTEAFDLEIRRARQAQAGGNAGQARVCARRAAGLAAGEFIARLGLPDVGPSVIDRLQQLTTLPQTPPQAQPAIRYLLLRVNEQFYLPEAVDLIEEAVKLRMILLGDASES